mmetsp:Transcript_10166/g.30182  ORF Transcript_10166/g.30182 Transcript_10166/m.30182 type:complete len:266 (-) Transcript_10166:330-1127(-)
MPALHAPGRARRIRGRARRLVPRDPTDLGRPQACWVFVGERVESAVHRRRPLGQGLFEVRVRPRFQARPRLPRAGGLRSRVQGAGRARMGPAGAQAHLPRGFPVGLGLRGAAQVPLAQAAGRRRHSGHSGGPAQRRSTKLRVDRTPVGGRAAQFNLAQRGRAVAVRLPGRRGLHPNVELQGIVRERCPARRPSAVGARSAAVPDEARVRSANGLRRGPRRWESEVPEPRVPPARQRGLPSVDRGDCSAARPQFEFGAGFARRRVG